MARQRLDVILTERGLADSRSQAQRMLRAGEVRLDGQLVDKPGMLVPLDATITVIARPQFVSRGGEKLAAALSAFGLDVEGMVAADVGACTGGFTDCLLQRGARRVVAIDVGYGQLDWRLRRDSRVVVVERTNARYLHELPCPIDLVTIDVSFISLTMILPQAVRWLCAEDVPAAPRPERRGHIVALIKPQFEAGQRDVRKGGVVRDPEVHRRVLRGVLGAACELGLGLRGLIASPLRGPAGNTEFLAWLELDAQSLDAEPLIAAVTQPSEGSA